MLLLFLFDIINIIDRNLINQNTGIYHMKQSITITISWFKEDPETGFLEDFLEPQIKEKLYNNSKQQIAKEISKNLTSGDFEPVSIHGEKYVGNWELNTQNLS